MNTDKYRNEMQKVSIRKKILKIRDKLSKKTIEKNSKKILNNLFSVKEFQKAKKIMFYSAFRNEIETSEMIKKTLELKKQVFLPKVVKNKIVPAQIKNLKQLVPGKFGILEPQATRPTLLRGCPEPQDTSQLDIVIVPGIAFDKNCNRLGFGRGYFDRLLRKQTVLKIGLAHNFQIVRSIPVSKNDVVMDIVITEKQIFKKANGGLGYG
ncbi:MAG: 5-formyltetrahydrofolate cyclo-ligase [Elusimicrobiota bacterium]